MKVEPFEDILAWQKAKKLTVTIYEEFKNSKDYSLTRSDSKSIRFNNE